MKIDTTLSPLPPVLQRAGVTTIAVLLVLMPLAGLPQATLLQNSMDTLRRLVLLVAAGLLVALILKAWAMRRQFVLRWHPLDTPVWLFLAAAVLTGLTSAYPRIALFAPLANAEISVLMIGILVVLYFGMKEFLHTRVEWERAAVLMVLAGTLVAVIGFADHFLKLASDAASVPFYAGITALSGIRLVGTMGNSMFTGTYLAMLIPLGIGTAIATTCRKRRALLLAGSGIMLFALLFTLARAAWVGLALALLILAGLALWRLRGMLRAMPKLALVAAAVVLLGLFAIGLSQPVLRQRLTSVVNMEDSTIKLRMVYMQGNVNAFIARPIQGWGTGVAKLVFPQFRPSSHLKELDLPLNRGYCAAQPHNLFLQTAAEMGLLGLIPFVLLIGVAIRSAWRLLQGDHWQTWFTLGLFGLLCTYLISNLFAFDNSATMANFWLGLGLLAAMVATERTLFVRAGASARPLSARAASWLSIASLVVALGTLVNAGMQFAAAHLTMRAIHVLQEVDAMREATARYSATQRAIGYLQDAVTLAPPGDTTPYQALTTAYQSLIYVAPDRKHAEEAVTAMFDAGEKGLERLDRDPILLRTLITEYIQWDEETKAQALARQLVRFEPNSAEVHLLYSQVIERNGQVELALVQAQTALRLDPTFPAAYERVAHCMYALVEQADPRTQELLPRIAEHYARAVELGNPLPPDAQKKYALTLFFLGRAEEGIVQGRELQGTQQFVELAELVTMFYTSVKREKELGAVLHALQQGMDEKIHALEEEAEPPHNPTSSLFDNNQ